MSTTSIIRASPPRPSTSSTSNRSRCCAGRRSTLYGKNTTAGAINITTNQPTFDFEGRAEVSVGNLDYRQAKAAISGPLTDKIAARIAIAATSRRGTLYNVVSDRWINEQDNLGLRGQLLFQPNENLSITLSGDYSKQNPEGYGTTYVRVGRTQRVLTRQYEALVAAVNLANPGRNYAVPSTNPYDRLTDLDASLNAGNKIGGVSARVKWDVGPGTLTSITAWRFWDWKPENDRDFTGLSIVSKSQNPSQQDQYSQEFRYNYEGDKVDFVVGLFGFEQRIDTQGTEQQGADASKWSLTGANADNPGILNGLTASNTQYLKSTSAALFGQLSWKVTDALTIQPGARINYDKKSGFYERVVTNGQGQVISCTPIPAPGTVAGSSAQCGVYQPQLSAPSDSAWNFTYDFNVNCKVAPDVLAYATDAKSFKTLGINQNGLPLNSDNTVNYDASTVKPESIDHFEIGLKTQFLDRRATFNLSAFRTNIKNFQATVNGGQFGTVRGYLANADKVRTQGIEADLKLVASDRFTAYANGAYTDAKYKKFTNAPCPPELSGGTLQPDGVAPDYSNAGIPNTASPRQCDISGPAPAGRVEMGLLLRCRGQCSGHVAGEGRAGLSGRRRQLSIALEFERVAVDLYQRQGLCADQLPRRFPRRRPRCFRMGPQRLRRGLYRAAASGPGNTGLIAGQVGDARTWGGTVKFSF